MADPVHDQHARGAVRKGGGCLELLVERDIDEAPVVSCTHCDLGAGAFCAGLTRQEFRRFMTILGQVQIDSNFTVFREGDPATHLYTLTSGVVKLYKLLSDGRRQITAFLFPGDFFGLVNGNAYAYTAETMAPVTLCRFPRRKLEVLCEELPLLERKLLVTAMHDLAQAHEQMLLLGRKTAREKVASFLVMLWRRLAAKDGGATGVMLLPMSRSDIADFLGLTIETVSRTLTAFKREGLIALPDASHVSIRWGEALNRIAEGN
jgi:CRP/FNR family transcriptional regulator